MKFYEKSMLQREISGKSTFEIGYEKQQKALSWVYRFGWSAAIVLDALAERTKRGYSKKLVAKKLLQETENEAAWGIKNAPKKFLTLTKLGVEEIEKNLEEEQMIGYPSDPRNLIRFQNARHDLFIQKYLLKKIEEDDSIEFKTAREFSKKSESGIKEPDLILIENHKNISIEIELTIKKGRELDQFCNSTIKALLDNRFDQTHIISDSNPIINKYSKILHDINAKVAVWKMKENRNWFKTDKVIESNASVAERIKFFKINDFEKETKRIIVRDDDFEKETKRIIVRDEGWDPMELLK